MLYPEHKVREMESMRKSSYAGRSIILRDAAIFEIRFACTQGWFARANWENKLHFIFTLLKLHKGIRFIRFFIEICKCRSKDVAYSENLKTSTFDIVPQSDNRELDPATVHYMMQQDILWFAEMHPDEQTDFLTALVRIGGSSLARRILQEIEVKLASSEKANEFLTDIMSRTSAVLGERITSKLLRKKRKQKEKNDVAEKETSKLEHEENEEFARYTTYGGGGEEEEDIFGMYHIDVTNEILNSPEVEAARRAWMEEMSRIQTDLDAWNPLAQYAEGAKAQPQTIDVDNMQMLPLWSTRRFARMLPSASQREIKKLNSFWNFTYEEMQKENNAQQFLERQQQKITGVSQRRHSRNSKSKPMEKGRGSKRLSSMRRSSKIEENEPEEEVKIKPRTRTIRKLLDASNVEHAHTYHDQYCTIDVSNDFHSSRVVACCAKTSLVALTTPKLTIIFYSILTGAQLIPSLEGHTGVITCLCFHCDGDKIFSGSSDLTVRCWQIWTGAIIKVYEGHEEPVICLSVNEKYVISGSTDKTIKVFNIESAQNIATFVDENQVSCIGIDNSRQRFVVGNNEGEIIVYSNQNRKKGPITIKGHNGQISTIYVSTPIILTGGIDGFAKAWNTKNFENCLVSMNHDSPVRAIALSHHQVLSGDDTGSIKIWCIFKGFLLYSIILTPDLCPVMQLLITSAEDNPSNVIIATECFVKIIDFYKKKAPFSHNHHTKCLDDPTRTTLYHAPACIWAIPKARTELLKNHNTIPKHYFTVKESHYHRRLHNMLARQCTVKKMRNDQPPNSHQSIVTDALRGLHHFDQLCFALVSFPQNKPVSE